MSALPPGWGDRHNTMSEKDMQLGGAAATKFASKGGIYADGSGTVTYKTSDQVRAHYNKKEELEELAKPTTSESLPPGWEQRQKKLAVEAKQHGAFARKQDTGVPAARSRVGDAPEVALLQVATFSLEALAKTLEAAGASRIKLPAEERAAFAEAVKRAMNAMASS
jgi:hypothetical protein